MKKLLKYLGSLLFSSLTMGLALIYLSIGLFGHPAFLSWQMYCQILMISIAAVLIVFNVKIKWK